MWYAAKLYRDAGRMRIDLLPRGELTRTARVLKRSLDISVSVMLLASVSIMLVLLAVGIKITTRGPVLYRDARRGKNGRVIHLLKFRTMVAGAKQLEDWRWEQDQMGGALFKIRDDPRVTPVGRSSGAGPWMSFRSSSTSFEVISPWWDHAQSESATRPFSRNQCRIDRTSRPG